jgi:hypothetical protein
MLGHKFYHATIRKYVALFGTLFNDIEIDRLNSTGGIYQTLKVPIGYAPKEKVLARITQDPNLNRKYAVLLPRMSFELTNVNYAGDRKLATINKVVKTETSDTRTLRTQYNPVPYDFMFNLNVYTKNAEDGTRIIEQILPYFTPSWTPSVNLIPEMGIVMDIPIVLLDVMNQDTYEGNFEERRSLTWTLNFLMKGYLFGPVTKKGIITLANTNFLDSTLFDDINTAPGEAEISESVSIKPGLTANGQPTSNASLSIDRNSISANSNYGYIITTTNG